MAWHSDPSNGRMERRLANAPLHRIHAPARDQSRSETYDGRFLRSVLSFNTMEHQSPSLSHPQSRGAHPFDAPLLPSPSPSAPRTAGVAVQQPDAKAHIASPPSSTHLGHHGDTPPPSTHSHSNATPGLLNAQQLPPYNLQTRAVTDHSPASLSDPAAANAFPDAFRFHIRNPSAAALTLQTADLSQPTATTTLAAGRNGTDISKLEGSVENLLRHSATAPISINDNHLRSTLSAGSMTGSLSPGSALSSPALNALADITPLPSPLAMTDSPASLWGKSHTSVRPRSRGASGSSRDDSLFTFNNNGTLSPSPSLKKKNYQRLKTDATLQSQHTNKINRARNSSLSEEFKPESAPNVRSHQRSLTQIPTHHGPSPFLHREAYLAAHRGLVSAASGPAGIPTPPASNRSVTESEEEEISEEDKTKYLIVRQGPQGNKKLWRPVRQLGQGTFSKVWLATSEKVPAKDPLDEATLDPHQLVAIKVVEHGPAGGADEERVMLSLKREVDMLRSISHPSLVHLKAFDHGDKQALLVLTYCPGGDLFDVASSSNNLLRVDLVQRIFAELVAATRYLHNQLIVHRDIKLESTALCSARSVYPKRHLTNVSQTCSSISQLLLSRCSKTHVHIRIP